MKASMRTMLDADFGTYHHTTREQSRHLQEYADQAFSKLLQPLYPRRALIRILDAGCGLGLLTYVAAKCFPAARITGVDLFRDGSLPELSMEKAVENINFFKLESRTSFLKHDLIKPLKSDVPYDLAVSNLVFHNLGKRRFEAYANVFEVLKPGAYFVIGDLFPHEKADLGFLRKRSTLVHQSAASGFGRQDYNIKVLQKIS